VLIVQTEITKLFHNDKKIIKISSFSTGTADDEKWYHIGFKQKLCQ